MPEWQGFRSTLRTDGQTESEIQQVLQENRELSRGFAADALEFAIAVYRRWGLVTHAYEALAREELRPVLEMKWSLVAVVPPSQDGPILHMVAFAHSDGTKLSVPALKRMYRTGFNGPTLAAPAESPLVTTDLSDPVTAYKPLRVGAGKSHTLSRFLTLLPRPVNRFVEAKLFVSNPGLSLALSKAIHALVMTLGIHRYSGDSLLTELIPQMRASIDDPMIAARLLDFAWEDLEDDPTSPVVHWVRSWQRWAILQPMQASFVLAEASQRRRINTFQMLYGIEPREIFKDDDFGGEPSALFMMPISEFETVPSERLSKLPGYAEYENARLLPTLTGLAHSNNCVQLMSWAATVPIVSGIESFKSTD